MVAIDEHRLNVAAETKHTAFVSVVETGIVVVI